MNMKKFKCSLVASFACLCVSFPLLADTEVVFPDTEAADKGAVLFVVVDLGQGSTTHILATNYLGAAIVETSEGDTTSLTITINETGEELTLTRNSVDDFSFIQNGEVVAEVSLDETGNWIHTGTEDLFESQAYEVLLIALTDDKLAQSGPWVQWGYWHCVWQVLKCEAITAACLASAIGGIPGCAALCVTATPIVCISCYMAWPGVSILTCEAAIDCWNDASQHGCVPW